MLTSSVRSEGRAGRVTDRAVYIVTIDQDAGCRLFDASQMVDRLKVKSGHSSSEWEHDTVVSESRGPGARKSKIVVGASLRR